MMDIKKLKEIVNQDMPDDAIENDVMNFLADDEDAILLVMYILKLEREKKTEILEEMNMLLSKADSGLDNPELNSENFMQKQIEAFYVKHKGFKGVGNNFKKYA